MTGRLGTQPVLRTCRDTNSPTVPSCHGSAELVQTPDVWSPARVPVPLASLFTNGSVCLEPDAARIVHKL